MTKRDFSEVIIKILGIYVIIRALPYISSVAYVFTYLQRDKSVLEVIGMFCLSLTSLLFVLLIGIFFISKSKWISAKLFKEDSEFGIKMDFDAIDLQRILFSVVGLFLVVSAGSDLFRLVTKAIYYSNHYPMSALKPEINSRLVAVIAKLILGTLLFFGSRGISNLWHRVQKAKYVKISDLPENSTQGEK